eukprot:scaffold174671_cov36-Cyclotella_meneghiniana.AAC.1
MAVESLLLTAKVGHLCEDFGRRGAFSGVSKFLCDKIFAGDPQVSWYKVHINTSTVAPAASAKPDPSE